MNRIPFYFSRANTRNKLRQANRIAFAKAMLAFFTIDYIKQFQPSVSYYKDGKSIRQMLLNESHFYEFIESRIRQHQQIKNLPMNNSLLLQLPQSIYREIMGIFEIDVGCKFDYKAYNQNRVKDATNSLNCIVAHPVQTTQIYFKKIVQIKLSILSGEKGTGKSFAFLLFDYFSSFILAFRLKPMNNSQLKTQGKYLPLSAFTSIPKMIYLNMIGDLKFSAYFVQIHNQTGQLLTKQEKSQWNLADPASLTREELVRLLATLQGASVKKNIKTMVIIDQANRIFALFRELEKLIEGQLAESGLPQTGKSIRGINVYNAPQKWRSSTVFKSLQFYSDLLDLLSINTLTSMNGTLLNSSQDFQTKLIGNKFSFLAEELPLIKLFGGLRLLSSPSNTSYSLFLLTDEGQIQLYNCFWFEILALVQKLGISKQIFVREQVFMSKYRVAFQQAFQIDAANRQFLAKEQKQFPQVKMWLNEVRHLHIREYLQQLQGSFKFRKLFPQYQQYYDLFSSLCDTPTAEELHKFKSSLVKLKAEIENYRKQSIIASIKEYLKKGLEGKTERQRLQYLNCLECQVSTRQSSTLGPYYEYTCHKIPEQQKGEFIIGLNCGYYNQSNNTLRFSSSKRCLMDIFKEVKSAKEYIYITMSQYLYMLVSRMSPSLHPSKFYGQMLNNFLYFIVNTKKYSFQLTYMNIQTGKKQKFLFDVAHSCAFQGFTQIVSEEEYSTYLAYREKGISSQSVLQISENKQSFNIAHPFHQLPLLNTATNYPITKKLVKQPFSGLIQLARQNESISQYILGFPAIFQNALWSPIKTSEQNSEQNNKNFLSCNNQMRFDHVLVRMIEDLEFVFIDWTLERPATKILNAEHKNQLDEIIDNENIKEHMKKQREFILQIKEILQYEGRVKCTFIIAAPQYYVLNYPMSYEKIGSWQVMLGMSSFGKDISVITEDKLVLGMKQLFTKIYECSKIIEDENKKGRQTQK